MEKKITILYVDDEPINLTVFQAVFSKEFFIITSLAAFEGLKELRTNKDIDLVITDMQMPKINGLEFIDEIKEDNPDMPCFILTGFEITPKISESIKAGKVIKYFRKPFKKGEIEEAITGLFH